MANFATGFFSDNKLINNFNKKLLYIMLPNPAIMRILIFKIELINSLIFFVTNIKPKSKKLIELLYKQDR